MKNPDILIEIYADISIERKELIIDLIEDQIEGYAKLFEAKKYAYESNYADEIFYQLMKLNEYEALRG